MPSDGSPIRPLARGSRWTAPALWAVVILIGTSWPSISVGPDVSGLDKLVHFGMYAVLTVLVLGVLLLGAVDEWHQAFIPGRSTSLADWFADSLGAVAGALAVRLLPFLAPARPGLAS